MRISPSSARPAFATSEIAGLDRKDLCILLESGQEARRTDEAESCVNSLFKTNNLP